MITNKIKLEPMIEPDYQELSNSNIPKAEESMGSQAPVYTIPPTTFFGFAIDPGAQFYQDQELQKSRIAFAHVLESGKGGAVFGSSESSSCFSTHCCGYGGLSMCMEQVISKKLRFVIIAGELIGKQSPFLMNTQAEMDMTIEDYHYGNNGFKWQSIRGHI
ncbi:hypothetical protein HID58_057216 [Brassica napus]|uniref:Pirin C-terminal domain-containing protein n=1 Tax=Brassica napus TaxID=3708 RepID=A0ABQ8ARD3_BRANA|nr:hypothetical protein HID58_057216 [Brassica napus]